MVAVVNPNANTSLDHQRQLALQSDFVLQPGDRRERHDSIERSSLIQVTSGLKKDVQVPRLTAPLSRPAQQRHRLRLRHPSLPRHTSPAVLHLLLQHHHPMGCLPAQ